MASALKTFDPKQFDLILGAHRVSGYGDGTFITAERNADASTMLVGSDGEGARAMSNDSSGIVTVTLLQTSLSNDFLSGRVILDQLTGDGVFFMMGKDRRGTTLFQAQTAYVQKVSNVELSREITAREWIIATNCLDMFVGGSFPNIPLT